jgi:hypothetical protein
MAIRPNTIYIFNKFPSKSQGRSSHDWKIYHKVHLETQAIANSRENTDQKEQCWRYHNTWLQTILQSIAVTTAYFWHKNRYEDQWNRIEDPDKNPYIYAHLILTKVPKTYDGECTTSSEKILLKKWLFASRKLKLDPSLPPCASINSKWIKNLNIRHKCCS